MAIEHTYRTDGYGGTRTAKLSPLKAIRQFCRECYGFAPTVSTDIRECPSELCPLWPFRFGRDPGRRVVESQREHGRRLARLAKSRKVNSAQKREFSENGSLYKGGTGSGSLRQDGVIH